MQSQLYPVPPPGASAMDSRGEQERVAVHPGGTDYVEEHKDEHKKKSVVEKVKQKAKKLSAKIRHPKGHGHGGEHGHEEEHGHEDDSGSEDETEETVSPATHSSDREVHGGDQYMKTVSGLETFGTKNIFDTTPHLETDPNVKYGTQEQPKGVPTFGTKNIFDTTPHLETDPNVKYGTQEQPKGVPTDQRAAAERPVTGEEAFKRKTEIPSSIVEHHPGITSESAGITSLLASRGSGGEQTTQIGSKATEGDQTSEIGSKTGTKSYEDAVSDRRFRDEGVGKVKDPIIPITGVLPEDQQKVESYGSRDEHERPKAYDDYVSDRRYRDEAAGKPERPIIPLTGFLPGEDRTDKQRSTADSDRLHDRNLDIGSTQEAGAGLRPVSGGQDKAGRDLNVLRKIGDEDVSDAQLPEEERPVSHVNLDTDRNNVQRAFDSDPSGFKLHTTSTAQAELQPQESAETKPFMTKIEAEPEAGYGSQTGAAESKPITQRAYDTIVGGSLAVAGKAESLLGFNRQSKGEGEHQPLGEGKDVTHPEQYQPLQEEGKHRPYPADEQAGHDQQEGAQGKPYTQRVAETVASLKNTVASKLGTGQAAESHEGTAQGYPQEGTAEEYKPSEDVELSKAPDTPEQHEQDRASSGSYIGSLKGTVLGLKDNVTSKLGYGGGDTAHKDEGRVTTLGSGYGSSAQEGPGTGNEDMVLDKVVGSGQEGEVQKGESKGITQSLLSSVAGMKDAVAAKVGYGSGPTDQKMQHDEAPRHDEGALADRVEEEGYEHEGGAQKGESKGIAQSVLSSVVGVKDAVASKVGYGTGERSHEQSGHEQTPLYDEQSHDQTPGHQDLSAKQSTAPMFNPGEEDTALSERVTDILSFNRTPSGKEIPVSPKQDKGVVGRMTDAVSSLFGMKNSGDPNAGTAAAESESAQG